MPILTVRNVPASVVDRLRARAARNHRSLDGAVVALLERVVTTAPPDADTHLTDVAAAHAMFPHGLPDIANEAKRHGRRYEGELDADGTVTR